MPEPALGAKGLSHPIRCPAVPRLPTTTTPLQPSCPIPTNQFDSAQQAGLQFSNYAGLVIQPLHAV